MNETCIQKKSDIFNKYKDEKKWGIIMPKLLGTEELKNILNFEYSKNTVLKNSKMYREFNVKAFNSISRINLQYGKRERRVCLYETLNGEKDIYSVSGKESVGKKDNRCHMILDQR